MIKVSDYIFRFVERCGVRRVYMLSGGGCMHLCDSLGRSGLEYVCCLHEQAAALAALGEAQYTRNLGVALATTGPGGTNTVTGLTAAYVDSIPLLTLTGQVKTADMSRGYVRMKGFQEVDIVSIVRPVTKYAVTVTEPAEIRYHLEKAVWLAKSGRPGPVLLDVPLDVQAALVEEEALTGFVPAAETPGTSIRETEEIASLLKRAERPVLLAGYGLALAGAADGIREFAEKRHIPVLTTWKGMDLFPEEHPDYYGRPGCLAGRGANFTLQNADLLLSLGARLDFGQIGYAHDKFAVRARKVIVDIDPAELNKFDFTVDFAVRADAGRFLRALDAELGDFVFEKSSWLARCREWKVRYPVIRTEHFAMRGYVSQYALMDFLHEKTGAADVFAPGNSGGCSEIFMLAHKVKKGQRIVSLNGLGSMGTGLPMALGAAAASGKRVICVNGDGGFQLNVQELETIRRLKLPIKFFILNNAGYNSIRQTQKRYFSSFFVGSDSSSGLTLPDSLALAAAYKIPAVRVSSHAELCDKADLIMGGPGPFLCEVMVDPDEPTLPRLQSTMDEQGRMVSRPLEDLYPFLPPEELAENMR